MLATTSPNIVPANLIPTSLTNPSHNHQKSKTENRSPGSSTRGRGDRSPLQAQQAKDTRMQRTQSRAQTCESVTHSHKAHKTKMESPLRSQHANNKCTIYKTNRKRFRHQLFNTVSGGPGIHPNNSAIEIT